MLVGLFARPACRQNLALSYVTDCKCFHRCLVPSSFPGHWSQVLSWGTIVIGPRSFPGDTPSLARGYPIPSLAGQGTPPPSQVRMVGYPSPSQGVPHPSQVRMGYPLAMTGCSTPPARTEQQSKHLLCGKQCASCIQPRSGRSSGLPALRPSVALGFSSTNFFSLKTSTFPSSNLYMLNSCAFPPLISLPLVPSFSPSAPVPSPTFSILTFLTMTQMFLHQMSDLGFPLKWPPLRPIVNYARATQIDTFFSTFSILAACEKYL